MRKVRPHMSKNLKKVVREQVEKSATPEPEKSVETLVAKEETKKEDNMNKLFLRQFFVNPEISDKVVTKLKGKVYFPKNPNIKPGWYVAAIINESESHGVMDTMDLADVPSIMWNPATIIGIYVKKNFKTGRVEIHKTIPKDKLDREESPVIYEFDMPPQPLDNGNSIKDIMEAKMKEQLAHEQA